MPRTYSVDARGLRCPLPYVKVKLAVEDLAPGDRLHVRFTDPEAPVDLAALAHDAGLGIEFGEWELTLTRPPRPGADRPPR